MAGGDEAAVAQRRGAKRQQRQQRWQERQERSQLTREEVAALRARREELRRALDAKAASATDANKVDAADEAARTRFTDLPLSQRTLLGLERGGYKKLTPIQSESLHLALAGYDVLGAAKTGSGKTLCFVVPILERLLVEHWTADLGVGALVLSPTRELALQIFKVLQVVGYKHVFSAALLTGGRDVAEERKRLHAMSIIVGTPGRVLHHLQDDSTVSFDNLQIFCMDEADRLLDLGFREALTSILDYLPPQRQALLFTATQSTDVQMLARIALHEPRYVSAHAVDAAPTPATLCQNFVVVELARKLDLLHTFLKRHPHDKVVVFVSTCNQVKFMYLAFAKILKKTHLPCMCLTSKMKQFRREEVFLTFCRCKSAVLFCTDVAARGLDFPLVHWVVQYDCPESAQTYIHRAGRTARAGARGVSLLLLTPQETAMLSYLAHKHVPLREVAVRPHLLSSSHEIFVALVVQGLKYEAQKAFIAYLRSVYFAANKHVFQLAHIDVAAFARSLGLLVVPDTSELQLLQRRSKNLPWDVVNYIAQRDKAASAAATANGNATTAMRSRKEKHLQASDMFRSLQQRQERFARKDDNDDDDDDHKVNTQDDDEDDTFLVKKKPSATATTTSSPAAAVEGDMRLTAEERLAGLSRHKRRRYIETADLRVRDLGLNTRIVYSSDDEDEDDAAASSRRAQAHTDKASTLAVAVPTDKDNDDDDDDDSASVDSEGAFAEQLRRRVRATHERDTARARQLRRLRRLQKEGKVSRKTTLEESVHGTQPRQQHAQPRVTLRTDDDDDDDDDDDSDVSTTSSMAQLLSLQQSARAAERDFGSFLASEQRVADDGDDDDEDEDKQRNGTAATRSRRKRARTAASDV